MRIAIAGTGHLGVGLLDALVHSEHEVVAVLQDGRKYPGWKRPAINTMNALLPSKGSMIGRARRHGIPVLWLNRFTDDALKPLRALDLDLILVGGFGIIFKKPILELPRVGCINCHSSLLPRHRGPNPFSAVLLHGETESGVTFHIMTERIDDGDILDQAVLSIDEEDTVLSIYHRSCALAADRVVDVVDRIAKKGLKGTPQDPALATYDARITEKSAWVDWTRSAVEIERMVRGLSPSPMPRMQYRGVLVRLAKVEVDPKPVDKAPGTILSSGPVIRVACGSGSVRLRVAFIQKPVPWIWPSPWSRPEVGTMVDPIPAGCTSPFIPQAVSGLIEGPGA
jgi:methionyl-tRNA formyltransferase